LDMCRGGEEESGARPGGGGVTGTGEQGGTGAGGGVGGAGIHLLGGFWERGGGGG
jgi:hypothetical protein